MLHTGYDTLLGTGYMINQPVVLSVELKAYLEQQDIYFYPQFGKPYKKEFDSFFEGYILNDKNNSFLICIGNEYHPDLEPRKHFVFGNADMLIQFYAVFHRTLPIETTLSTDGEMIIEWNVFIQKCSAIDKGNKIESISMSDAKEAITDLIYSLKDVTGFNLSKIAGIKINFRNSE